MSASTYSAFAVVPSFGIASADRICPIASLLLVFVPPVAEPASSIPIGVMVRKMRDAGLPLSLIAEITQVERKTVYSWLSETATPRPSNTTRIETLFDALFDGRQDLRSVYRVVNRRLSHGHSLRNLLCADLLSVPAIKNALSELSPALKHHDAREVARTPTSGANPFHEEMPEAGAIT